MAVIAASVVAASLVAACSSQASPRATSLHQLPSTPARPRPPVAALRSWAGQRCSRAVSRAPRGASASSRRGSETPAQRSLTTPIPWNLNAILLLRYDGSRFAGTYYNRNDPAQSAQPNRTVEGAVEAALAAVLRSPERSGAEPASAAVRVSCLSRTDKGVSAACNAAVCAIPGAPAADGAGGRPAFVSWADALAAATNEWLRDAGAGASVVEVRPLPPQPDGSPWAVDEARLAGVALGGVKRYEYLVRPGADADSECMGNLEGLLAWHVPEVLDVEAMREAASALRGEHDFRAFTAKHGHKRVTRRRILEVAVDPVRGPSKRGQPPSELLRIRVVGESFLYRMVRFLAFCLVAVGRGQRSPGFASSLLQAGDRSTRKRSFCYSGGLRPAPAHGLTLAELRLREPTLSPG